MGQEECGREAPGRTVPKSSFVNHRVFLAKTIDWALNRNTMYSTYRRNKCSCAKVLSHRVLDRYGEALFNKTRLRAQTKLVFRIVRSSSERFL